MKGIVLLLDGVSERLGGLCSWLMYATMALTAAVVVLRYGLNSGSIALQESATYIHATVLMLAVGFTLKRGAHVRVDIFYRQFSARTQAWIDALGALCFTLPVSLFLLALCWDFAAQSWAILERSAEAAGLPFVYLLKSLLPLGMASLALQALAELLRAVTSLVDNEFVRSQHEELKL